MDPRRLSSVLALLVVAGVALAACRGGGIGSPRSGSGARGSPEQMVSLSAAELSEVDAFFSAKDDNARWIVGDDVDVVASKEYFARLLTFNRGPLVSRTDRADGETATVTLRFLGSSNQASVLNNPRVQIGTGLTVSAFREIRIRMVPTTDPALPVRINVVARGNASRGHKDEVLERAALIQTGGNLVQRAGRWTWVPSGI